MIYRKMIVNDIRKALLDGKSFEEFVGEQKWPRFEPFLKDIWQEEVKKLEELREEQRLEKVGELYEAADLMRDWGKIVTKRVKEYIARYGPDEDVKKFCEDFAEKARKKRKESEKP